MADEKPLLRVVRGSPTAEEVAALVGVILRCPKRNASAAPAAVSTWVRLSRPGTVSPSGLPTQAGRDAWRVSGLPR
ncbi:acyl-CoA carboxylase subunit epsilon [Micromonospora sp. HM5-17]|jgi:hypothetical protein|uniref:acyl-CoA carboxylase subunit epsilon n=1 Tax=Micromonospora sp. HM5-17 TaxID=2487710 RepID=UPI000F461706|nr:acyl-CoA carboxylase subunit epsilon [Micromonospora sp. HM5-17]ROT32125.1 acyl-CoA carboxylase subunit epsilon [Micromonospora sp. HM5-17]